VIPAGLDEGLESSLKEAFLGLQRDPEGRAILSGIGIRRFVSPRPDDYRMALETYRRAMSAGRRP